MKVCSITDIGVRREMNQDYFYSSEEPVGRLPNLFLVADGMGGHQAGEFASRFTVETVVDTTQKSEYIKAAAILEESIRKANTLLKEKADENPEMKGMGTTIVAATIKNGHLTVANVGDSRLYLAGDTLNQITKDHSLVQEMVRMGEMDEETAKNHPDKNIITRAIGIEQEIEIDFFDEDIFEGQRILLCSDGLTNMLEDGDILRILNGSGELQEKAERLIDLANKNGGKDNITVIIIEPNTDEVKTC